MIQAYGLHGMSKGAWKRYSAQVSDRAISLPLSAKLTDQDVSDVIDAVSSVLTTYKK